MIILSRDAFSFERVNSAIEPSEVGDKIIPETDTFRVNKLSLYMYNQNRVDDRGPRGPACGKRAEK